MRQLRLRFWGLLILTATFLFAPDMSYARRTPGETRIKELSDQLAERYARNPKPRINLSYTCTGNHNPEFTVSVKRCSGICLRNKSQDLIMTLNHNEASGQRNVVISEATGSGPRCLATYAYPENAGRNNPTALQNLAFYDGTTQNCDGSTGLVIGSLSGGTETTRIIQSPAYNDRVPFAVSQFVSLTSDSLDLLNQLDQVGRSCCDGTRIDYCPSNMRQPGIEPPTQPSGGTLQ